ncbi:MAG: hypothetical protein MHM6MM_003072 [Cercozoa sp. M6MM]
MSAVPEKVELTPEQLAAKEEKKKRKQAEKAAKKAKKEAQRLARLAAQRGAPKIESIQDGQFGDFTLFSSKDKTDREFTQVSALTSELDDQVVWLRARVDSVRKQGKGAFVVFRDDMATVQGILFEGEEVPRAMVKYVQKLPKESVVDVCGVIKVPRNEAGEAIEVASCSQKQVELHISRIYAVSVATDLPFTLADAARRPPTPEEIEQAKAEGKKQAVTVGEQLRLDYRWVDVRTPAKQAIFRVRSGVSRFYREYMHQQGFVEINSPKLIGGTSEGGSEVFRLDYFGRDACLAQSPQLYKQMAIMGDFPGVFEIGPVFRAENSHTHRHLCEFVGMDFEMQIRDHYHEATGVLSGVFTYIFDKLNEHYAREIAVIREQFPSEPLKYDPAGAKMITFKEAFDMIQEEKARVLAAEGELSDEELEKRGFALEWLEDFSTPNEKLLGRLMKAKYDTEFYIVDKYPLAVRPFYTMPDPNDAELSNSYDVFLRGQEITSGAQRVHCPDLLAKRASEHEIPLETIQSYIDCFKHGAPPHAGGGIGLERVVMLFLDLPDVRNCSLFPRDPTRIAP